MPNADCKLLVEAILVLITCSLAFSCNSSFPFLISEEDEVGPSSKCKKLVLYTGLRWLRI